jgi:hypothetical protein
MTRVNRVCELPAGKFYLHTYAELDAGKLPEGCYYFEQLSDGKRYGAGCVLVVTKEMR